MASQETPTDHGLFPMGDEVSRLVSQNSTRCWLLVVNPGQWIENDSELLKARMIYKERGVTKLEALDNLKARALADFAEAQEEYAKETGNKRNDEIDARMAEVRAAATIGDVLHLMGKYTAATSLEMVDDEPTFSEIPDSCDPERVCLFILRAMGVQNLTLQDVQPSGEELGDDDEVSE